MNLISGDDQTSSRLPAFSLSFPGSGLNSRDRRNTLDVWSVRLAGDTRQVKVSKSKI